MATTTQVREWLEAHGEKLTPDQTRISLHALARSKPPRAALAQKGRPGFGTAGLWQITEHGHNILSKGD